MRDTVIVASAIFVIGLVAIIAMVCEHSERIERIKSEHCTEYSTEKN